MSDNIKTAITLFLITLISGLALGAVYGVTKEPIELANQQATLDAYESLIPGAAEYQEEAEFAAVSNAASGESASIDSFVAAVDESGEAMGYIVTVTAHGGYGGDIQMTVGYQEQDGKIVNTGISFLSISETAGLGMNADTDEFKGQFVGKLASDQLSVTKTGNAGETEINAISGATVTTTAVTNGVNAANLCVESYIEQNG